jgi:hypothetical protein
MECQLLVHASLGGARRKEQAEARSRRVVESFHGRPPGFADDDFESGGPAVFMGEEVE